MAHHRRVAVAYLLGGLQIRGLYRELVESGRMEPKSFHDAIVRQGSMPIALLRLAIADEPLSPETSLRWRFYGDPGRTMIEQPKEAPE